MTEPACELCCGDGLVEGCEECGAVWEPPLRGWEDQAGDLCADCGGCGHTGDLVTLCLNCHGEGRVG